MPEFIMPTDGHVDGHTFNNLDAFTRGYIEALFFTETDSSVTSNEVSVDHEFQDGSFPGDATFGDIYPSSLESIIDDCRRFQETNATLLESAYRRPDYSPEQAGRDFWFTHNGHGVGFWDRKQLEADRLGADLSDACEAFGEASVSWGTAADGDETCYIFVE